MKISSWEREGTSTPMEVPMAVPELMASAAEVAPVGVKDPKKPHGAESMGPTDATSSDPSRVRTWERQRLPKSAAVAGMPGPPDQCPTETMVWFPIGACTTPTTTYFTGTGLMDTSCHSRHSQVPSI